MAPWPSLVPKDRAAVAEPLFREVAGVHPSQESGQTVGYQSEISAASVREAVQLLAGGVVPNVETTREIEMPVVLGHKFTSKRHVASGPTRGIRR